ncbi:MAG: repeat protein, partial [Dehalococcoidia bacterium]|nr:repeat protein [Dehalococcoidia bacterium]
MGGSNGRRLLFRFFNALVILLLIFGTLGPSAAPVSAAMRSSSDILRGATHQATVNPKSLTDTAALWPSVKAALDSVRLNLIRWLSRMGSFLPLNQDAQYQPAQDQIQEKVSVTVTPDKESLLESADKKMKVKIPAGAVSEKVTIELSRLAPFPSSGMKVIKFFELKGAAPDRANAAVKTFLKPLEITLVNTPEELEGLDNRSVRLYYLDEADRQWKPLTGTYDRKSKVLTAQTTHFTYFGEMANPVISGPGRIMAADVNLHSGAAAFSYPIELPDSPGGFRPKLDLIYNSGSADEMKNKRSMGSWVGIGWALSPGSVNNIGDKYMNLNGIQYELIPSPSPGSYTYYTRPDSSFKIVRYGGLWIWEMWDQDGTYYRFGGTENSDQFYMEFDGENYTAKHYRSDLNLIRDTHNNEITVTYARDFDSAGGVRSAYPEYIRYNGTAVEVRFNSSFDETDPYDGHFRKDSPKSTGYNPAPYVMENKKLDSIEVKVSGSLVRKYLFTYTTTDRVLSGDYGGIYYSGTHTLTSVTQVGADGGSTLPAMSLSYGNLQTYIYDSSVPQYTGNPGNAASFSWPHLMGVTNGYGGT